MDQTLRNKKTKRLLWVDLEMTGLDPSQDKILEIGAIVTDWDFNEIATFEAAVHAKPAFILKRFKRQSDFWDANPAARNGLIEQNKTARSSKIVEKELLAFIDAYFDELPVVLAGNSIHQDRRFIISQWPLLDARLHYRMLDVTAWKVVFEGKFGKKFAKPEEHRAIGDIRGSIMELKYYLSRVRSS